MYTKNIFSKVHNIQESDVVQKETRLDVRRTTFDATRLKSTRVDSILDDGNYDNACDTINLTGLSNEREKESDPILLTIRSIFYHGNKPVTIEWRCSEELEEKLKNLSEV